jgi:hypothetical protein
MRFDYEDQSADVALDGAMTIEDSKRAEAPTALQAQCRGRIERQNIGSCAVVIVAVSLLGWAIIVWPLVGFFR